MVYKLAIFDLDGTLCKYDENKRTALVSKNALELIKAKRIGMPSSPAEETLARIKAQYGEDISIGLERIFGIDRKMYFQYTWDFKPEIFFQKDENLRPAVLGLKEKLKLAVLTNAPEVWVSKVLDYECISDLFDGIWCGDGDIRKPQRKAYLQVLEAFSIARENAIMVDDKAAYVPALKELGISSALITDGRTDAEPDFAFEDVYGLFRAMSKTPGELAW